MVSEDEIPGILAPESEISIVSSDAQVSEFVARNEDFVSSYDADECYNITPDFIADQTDFAIFKYAVSSESFLLYDDEVYSIGRCFGGYGITSMALADLNKDGQYELYYTFSWGSGMHRSQIGYFDPGNRETTIFDYALLGYDMMLTAADSGALCVNVAALDMESFVDFSASSREPIGTIVLEGGKITLKLL